MKYFLGFIAVFILAAQIFGTHTGALENMESHAENANPPSHCYYSWDDNHMICN